MKTRPHFNERIGLFTQTETQLSDNRDLSRIAKRQGGHTRCC